jgi:hypothetical protein
MSSGFKGLTNVGMCWQIFVNLHSIKFQENPFSGSQVVTCEQKDVMLISVFLQPAVNTPKKHEANHTVLDDDVLPGCEAL